MSSPTEPSDTLWQISVQQRNIKQKAFKIDEPALTIFVTTPSSHLTLARTVDEVYQFDQTLRATYPSIFEDLPLPSLLSRPMAGSSTSSRFTRSTKQHSNPTLSSTSTVMPASQRKSKPAKKMFHSISRTLSPAIGKTNSRKLRPINPSSTLPTPPASPDRRVDDSQSCTVSEASEEDDFVDVRLSESEKQYISQIEVGNGRHENQLGSYLTSLAHRSITSSAHDSQHTTSRPISKLVREAKEWQAFFKIGKNDFERERKSQKRDSHSLTSSLNHCPPSGSGNLGALRDNARDNHRLPVEPNPALMKRVKSDQIVYATPSPVLHVQRESSQCTEKYPEQSSQQDILDENSPSARARRSLEAALGLSPSDADALTRLSTDIDNDRAFSSPQKISSNSSSPATSSEITTSPLNDYSVDGELRPIPSEPHESTMLERTKSESVTTSKSPAQRRRYKVTVNDFEIMRVLGKGCAGKVLMVKYRGPGVKHPDQVYAMKSIKKNHVLSHRELQHTLTEQNVLRRVADNPESNPFIVRLYWSFHDKDHLFLVMDFHPGGDLATQLARWGRLGRDRARFYAAEIIEGVTSLHHSGVIYRDLKPENILIAFDGHIVLTDFGLSKQFERDADGQRVSDDEDERTLTFCGTAEYLAPEVLLGEPYSYEVDWWSFGTMLYEMLTGLTPFWSEDHATMYRRVLHDELVFSEDCNRLMDHDTKTLLRGLLQRNPAVRMTGERIKKHPYFGMIDWDHVQHKRYIPPYVPAVNPNDATDTQNFDETFLAMEPTYVQDDDPPQPGAEERKDDNDEGDADAEADQDPNVRKIEPQRGIDENGRDVFDGYSYLAPSHDRESVIFEDEEAERQDDDEDETGHIESTIDPTESPGSFDGQRRPQNLTKILINESEDPDLPTSNDEGEGDDWDVINAPQDGQTDFNGRLGKNTLFARGVKDRYRLRMRKFNDNSVGFNSSSNYASSLRPFGSSKSSFIKSAQHQFTSVGNQSSISSINQLPSDWSDQATGGSLKPKKRFGLRSSKKTGHTNQSTSPPSESDPRTPSPKKSPASTAMPGLELSNVGSQFLKKTSSSPTANHSHRSSPHLVEDLSSKNPQDGLIGGVTINPKKKKTLVAGLM